MTTAAESAVVYARGGSYGRTVAVLTLVGVATAIQQTTLTPALPTIQRQLGVSTTAVAWLLTGFVLSASIVTPILGRLSDIFGRRQAMLAICATVATGSLIGGFAHSLPVLILARVLQGMGGSVFVVAFGILRDEAPPGQRATGFGIVSSAYGAGGGAGYVLSGFIVEGLSYRWLFWLAAIAFAIAGAAVYVFIAESPVRTPAGIDGLGAGLLTAGLLGVLLGIGEAASGGWTSRPVLELLGFGLLTLAVWSLWELRRREPLIDLRLLRVRLVWTMNVVSGLIGFGIYMLLLLVPKFVMADPSAGFGFGVSAVGAGMFLVPWTVLMMSAAASSGLLAKRFGPPVLLLAGSAVAIVAYLLLAFVHGRRWQVVLASGLLGLSMGLMHSSMANLVTQAVAHAQVGEAMGVLSVGRTVGSALGTQVGATVVASVGGEQGYTVAFLIAAVVATAAFACSLVARSGRPLAPAPAEPPGPSDRSGRVV